MKTNEENFQRTVINSCYSCEYVNAPNFENSNNDNIQLTESFSCNSIAFCLDPSAAEENSWFRENCIEQCPDHKPYCYFHKHFFNDNLITIQRGCQEIEQSSNFEYFEIEKCEAPTYAPTKTRNCEIVCDKDLCNGSTGHSRFQIPIFYQILVFYYLILRRFI